MSSNIEVILGIVGGIAGLATAFNVGTLIKFHFERKDSKDNVRRMTVEHEEALRKLEEENESIKAMCLGFLYDRAKFLGEQYIKRGHIMMQEYSDWNNFLYKPYTKVAQDSTVDKIKIEIDKLPIEG